MKNIVLALSFLALLNLNACQYNVHIHATPDNPTETQKNTSASPTPTPTPVPAPSIKPSSNLGSDLKPELEAVVRSFANAINTKNSKEFQSIFHTDSELSTASDALFKSLMDANTKYEIKEIQVAVTDQTKPVAQVSVAITDKSGTVNKKQVYEFRLQDNKWKIFNAR